MYKKALSVLLVMHLIFLFGTLSLKGIAQNRQAAVPVYEMKLDERVLAEKSSSTMGIVETAVSGQRVANVQLVQRTNQYILSEEDLNMLLRIVEAEAGNQDEEGKLLVANVVLNRVEDEAFPDTVTEVVLQRENGVCQFSPVSNQTIWKVCISEETESAVERALQGEEISDGALYFAAREYADSDKMKWFDTHLTFLFKHGGHEFFK